MNIIVTGCEYAGKTTTINRMVDWIGETFGSSRGFHDHFTFPCAELSVEEQDGLMQLGTAGREMFQRYMIDYHINEAFYSDPDHNLGGFHIEEAVYAPMYNGYGAKGQYAYRTDLARSVEKTIMERAPHTVLVLVRATPDVIRQRMKDSPRPVGVPREEYQNQGGISKGTLQHPRGILPEGDIEHVVERFDEEFSASLLRRKITLDTSEATPDESMAEFVEQVKPHITERDRLRMMAYRAMK